MSTPSPESSGLPLRALAMVLLSAAIVFAGLGFISMSDSGDGSSAAAAPSSSAQPTPARNASPSSDASPSGDSASAAGANASSAATSATSAASSTPSSTASAADAQAGQEPVRVYNNSTVDGLAADTASTLKSDGWSIGEVANYDGGAVPRSTVYYGDGPGEKAAAQKIGSELGFAVEPRFDGIDDAAPGVIVILTADR